MSVTRYDITIDEHREVTQADWDAYERGVQAYGFMITTMRRLTDLCPKIAAGDLTVAEARAKLTDV